MGFAMPDETPRSSEGAPARAWRESELRRAISAAEKAGLHHYRVEIAPDGTIAIVVGTPPD